MHKNKGISSNYFSFYHYHRYDWWRLQISTYNNHSNITTDKIYRPRLKFHLTLSQAGKEKWTLRVRFFLLMKFENFSPENQDRPVHQHEYHCER